MNLKLTATYFGPSPPQNRSPLPLKQNFSQNYSHISAMSNVIKCIWRVLSWTTPQFSILPSSRQSTYFGSSQSLPLAFNLNHVPFLNRPNHDSIGSTHTNTVCKLLNFKIDFIRIGQRQTAAVTLVLSLLTFASVSRHNPKQKSLFVAVAEIA